MTRIICRASECVYYEDGVCGSEEIEYDPDAGCLTFEDISDLPPEEEEEPFVWVEESDGDLLDEDEDEDEDEEEGDWKEEDDWQDDWDEEGER
ncbi:MAG: hypothetical protein JXM73_06550 [Anaerolineae bacterium]|nr:hypothetical protein [Anaerolineae bacterium]